MHCVIGNKDFKPFPGHAKDVLVSAPSSLLCVRALQQGGRLVSGPPDAQPPPPPESKHPEA